MFNKRFKGNVKAPHYWFCCEETSPMTWIRIKRASDLESVSMGLLPDTLNCGLRMRRECRERFPHPRRLEIPTCITARASRTCRDAMPGSLTCVFLWSWWLGKRSRHSRRMRNPQFYLFGKRFHVMVSSWSTILWQQMPYYCVANHTIKSSTAWHAMYLQTSNTSRTLVANKIVDHSDVAGASPAGAAPTTSSFAT